MEKNHFNEPFVEFVYLDEPIDSVEYKVYCTRPPDCECENNSQE